MVKSARPYRHVEPRLRTKDIEVCVKQIQENIAFRNAVLREEIKRERDIREMAQCTHRPIINRSKKVA